MHLRQVVSWDDGVTGDGFGDNTTSSLDTEGERENINENDILSSNFTRENTTLDGSTVGSDLIRVDTLGRLLAAEVLLEELFSKDRLSRS